MFEQMHGMPQQRQRQRQEAAPQGIHDSFNWMKATTWHWNSWRDVRFGADGRFEAPTPDCERGMCRWSTDASTVYIRWGESGLHKVKPAAMEAVEGNTLRGKRVSNGEKCFAVFKSKEERDEDLDLYEILGVDDEADQKAIKKAYRQLSLKYPTSARAWWRWSSAARRSRSSARR